jgi:hypothetical protein
VDPSHSGARFPGALEGRLAAVTGPELLRGRHYQVQVSLVVLGSLGHLLGTIQPGHGHCKVLVEVVEEFIAGFLELGWRTPHDGVQRASMDSGPERDQLRHHLCKRLFVGEFRAFVVISGGVCVSLAEFLYACD